MSTTSMLSSEEATRVQEFLGPSHIAIVATIRRDGTPQITPNWYRFDSGRLTISTTKQRVKYRNLSRDPRLVVCITSEPRAENYLTLSGLAEIVDDGSMWPDTRAIVEKYVPPDRVDERMRQLRTEDRVIISMVPGRAVFRV